jgi:Zn-dependent protease with chaperone function
LRHAAALAGFAAVILVPLGLACSEFALIGVAGATAWPGRLLELLLARPAGCLPIAWGAVALVLLTREWALDRALRKSRRGWTRSWPDARLDWPTDVPLWSGPEGTPSALGLRRGAVYVPRRLGELDPESRRRVLAHELAHVRRRDPLIDRVVRIALASMWLSPGAWWLAAVTRREREAAADEAALGPSVIDARARVAYARTLVRVAAWRPRSATPVAIAGAGDLGWRVRRLLASAPVAAGPARVLLATLILAAVSLAIVLPHASMFDCARPVIHRTVIASHGGLE